MEEVNDKRFEVVKDYIEKSGINVLPEEYRVFFCNDLETNYCCTINYNDEKINNYIMCSVRDEVVKLKAFYYNNDIIAIFKKDNNYVNLVKGQRKYKNEKHVERLIDFNDDELILESYEIPCEYNLSAGIKEENIKVLIK